MVYEIGWGNENGGQNNSCGCLLLRLFVIYKFLFLLRAGTVRLDDEQNLAKL